MLVGTLCIPLQIVVDWQGVCYNARLALSNSIFQALVDVLLVQEDALPAPIQPTTVQHVHLATTTTITRVLVHAHLL